MKIVKTKKALRRNCSNRILFGVFGGLDEYINIRSNIIRIILPWILRIVYISIFITLSWRRSSELIGQALILVYFIPSFVIPLESNERKERERDWALKLTIIPPFVVLFVCWLALEDWGYPQWVGYPLWAGVIYWLIAVLALIVFLIRREWHRAKWLGIGIAIGLFFLLGALLMGV